MFNVNCYDTMLSHNYIFLNSIKSNQSHCSSACVANQVKHLSLFSDHPNSPYVLLSERPQVTERDAGDDRENDGVQEIHLCPSRR